MVLVGVSVMLGSVCRLTLKDVVIGLVLAVRVGVVAHDVLCDWDAHGGRSQLFVALG